MSKQANYPPIGDYAFIADSNSTALVSRAGSIDWCCIQRIDAGSCFGRLLDREQGGYCEISPNDEDCETSREYIGDTLVLQTTFQTRGGEARLYDCFTMPASMEGYPNRQLLRVVEGVRGHVELDLKMMPRFDYGSLEPWLRQEGANLYSVIGGDDGLLVSCDSELSPAGDHDLEATISVHAGERVRFSIISVPPENLDYDPPKVPSPEENDRRLQETIDWWSEWSSHASFDGPYKPGVIRSAITIKALMNERTGAIAAAATTSLPESPGGSMNWDYRYSWVRDSFFSVNSLAQIGFDDEANRFRRFMERSTAGSAQELQIMYGVGGERRLTEETLDYLDGYKGAKPVRVGNAASGQLQLGVYGELLELTWGWHQRGNSPDDDFWRFLLGLVDQAAELWKEPDHGIWEMRGDPQHFVTSKVLCWAALDRGLRLAEECMRKAPERRWKKARDEARESIENNGYDQELGTFTQTYGSKNLDAALLLMPRVGFISYDDERMIRTTDAIREQLDDDGLLKRHKAGDEGAFLACSFWLVECLAHQGRVEDAQAVFDRTLSASNDLGLFSEEYDTGSLELLGNFPQGLTHLSHITAAIALAQTQVASTYS